MTARTRVGAILKKAVILVVGVMVILAGVAMLVLPGPGILVIIVGLLILSTEFEWAQRWLDIAVEKSAGTLTKVSGSKSGRLALGLSGVGMIITGIAIIIFFTQFAIAGGSLILAGVIGLGTLHPRIDAWVQEKALYGIDGVDDVH
ncbi:MAG: hypothetical protein ACJAXA_003092 [Candidatus Aldehydirespiratoraceae bacterium]|jgi:uncharacterized protein (TIGR02611 family)